MHRTAEPLTQRVVFIALRSIRLLGVLGVVSILGGCGFFLPNQIHYAYDLDASGSCEDCVPESTGDTFVGLAFSGGGSRAAVFAAAGAEALAKRGLMNSVTHVSSVSGGSFAAAYIGLNAPHVCGSDGHANACLQANFDAFQQVMREDYFLSLGANQVTNPWRITSPTRRISSLIEALDAEYIGGRTFAELRGIPILLFNAADYDDGSRFILSNLALSARPDGDARYGKAALSANSFSRFGVTKSTPGDFPISLAVASSAAFPGVLGPVTLQVPAEPGRGAPTCEEPRAALPDDCEYWHLGDGGILENTGVETLQEVMLRKLDGPAPIRQALILSFDAGRGLVPDALRRDEDPALWTEDFDRVVEISNIRANAYKDVAWAAVERDLEIPYKLISMRLIEAELTDNDWPASCPSGQRHEGGIRLHLRSIPTLLSINDCNADLASVAAEWLVENKLTSELLADLSAQGYGLTLRLN